MTGPDDPDEGGRGSPASAGEPGPARRPVQVRDVCGVLALLRPVPSEPEIMLQAVVSGVVAVLDGRCLGLAVGRERQLVVWPSTTTFDPDRIVVRVPGLGVFRVGDRLRGAGGHFRGADMLLPPLSTPCTTRSVAVLNEVQVEAGRSRAERRRSWRL